MNYWQNSERPGEWLKSKSFGVKLMQNTANRVWNMKIPGLKTFGPTVAKASDRTKERQRDRERLSEQHSTVV